MSKDMVNHPSHYEGNTSIECIDAMVLALGRKAVMDFCLGNAFKYLWRHKHKNGLEDLEKAKWYLLKWNELSGWGSISADHISLELNNLITKAKELLEENTENDG